MNKKRVVITGMGVVSPLGLNQKDTWAALIKGQSGVAKISSFDTSDYPSKIAGEVSDFDASQYFDTKECKRLDRFSMFALFAAREAWKQAEVPADYYTPERMGCILGVGIGGLHSLEVNHQALLEGGPRKVSPFLIPAMISNLGPGNIAIELNLQGVNYTVTSACTSGTHSIGEGFRMVRDGLQDLVVVGGSEAAITPVALAGFSRMRALSTRNDEPEKASRPFDADRDGFVIGEGSGILLVESAEHAKKRGANILCEVAGYGFSCDASHITAPAASGIGAINSMRAAINSAGLSPEKIDYINCHGTSTPINDSAETQAIKAVFGDYAKSSLLLSSTKSMTGHLLGAAGGVEAVFSALSILNKCIPPTINLDKPDSECDLDYVPHQAREADVKVALSNSFGFGGTNASIVLKEFEE